MLRLGAAALVVASAVVAADARTTGSPELRTFDKGTALIFTTTDCPIANRYAPEIGRLYREFSARGIRFRLVYVNPRESEDIVREHAARFELPLPLERDPGHQLVKQYGITVTPEVAVLNAAGTVVYRGRIDDRYTAIGVDRQRPTQREFADALTALATGTAVRVPNAPAVGCFVADFQPATYARDIAPVLFDRCTSCHRPSGPAPFSLLTYAEARQRASLIAEAVDRRYMPPYNATSGAGTFQGQKQLSAREIALVREWVDAGAPEGDPADAPAPPHFPAAWQLGDPDLVVTTPAPYILQAEPSDVFRIFVIRLPVTSTKYVRGIEFLPGNPRVVHHANIRLDRTSASRDLDARDPAPGYDGLLARSAVYPEGHFLGWTPGQVAPLVSSELAWRLEPGTDLVVQLHMQPSGAREHVQPSIAFFFSDSPPQRTPTILRLGSQGLDIPAGDNAYRITDSYVLPVAVELHALQPHAHYRLVEARGTATLPDGSDRELIRIERWDFRWQHVYRFEQPVRLPKGTRVAMAYRYDNSAGNPRNPQLPPQRVFWGQRSFDEMGDLWFQFVADNAADRAQLEAEISAKMTAEDVIGYETMLRAAPNDAELHDDAAVLYLALGHADDAVRHFRASAQLKPEAASAHFNLGTALSMAGQLDAAVRAFEEALRLRPGYAVAHNNLGTVLAAQGRLPDAIDHFRRAAREDPGNVQAHRNFAWYVARLPEPSAPLLQQARDAAARAVALTGAGDPSVLDALAAIYTASGMVDEAAAAADRARRLRERR